MKIVCISDMHGNLNFTVPECDLLLIAGDICPATHNSICAMSQANWMKSEFKDWLCKQPIQVCIAIAGNHDWMFESMMPPHTEQFCYVENKTVGVGDLKIYGSPVSLSFGDWAFNVDEDKIQKYWDNIPSGLDILLLHSPPYGIMDETDGGIKIGCKRLLKKIQGVRPKLVVFGHNHNGHGVQDIDGIKYVNASLLNERYDMVNQPIVIDI